MKKITIYIICILSCLTLTLNAQPQKGATKKEEKKKEEPFVKYRGNIGIYYDVYTYNQNNYDNFRARYPSNLFRLNASMSLSFGQYFTVPISLNVTNQKVLFTYPQLPQGNIVDYIKNPKNNISIKPKYKWIQGYIGTQTPTYSELTTGDMRIFGIGADINPKKFIFSFSHGISQLAIEPNKEFNMEGAYKQKMTAFRIGIGSIQGSKFTLNVVKVKDDVNSITEKPLYSKPIDGVTVSPLLETRLFKKLFLKTETAASIFTNNLNNEYEVDEPFIEKLHKFIDVNGSTQAGLAHKTSLMWKSGSISVGGEFKFVSAAFLPVGYRNAERDYIDYKLNTNFQVFKKSTYVNGSFGIRTNNVQNTTVASTKRIIGNLSVNSRITKHFSVNANFSNFGFKDSNGLSLQDKIEITNNTFSLTPSYNFETKKARHLATLTTSFVNYKQFEAISNSYVNTTTTNLNLMYGMFFKKIPLTTQITGMFMKNKMPNTELAIMNIGTSVGYKFFKRKLSTKLSLNYVNVKRQDFTADNRITSNLQLNYKITKKMRFAVNYRMNQYKYGSAKPDASTGEHRLQFALSTSF